MNQWVSSRRAFSLLFAVTLGLATLSAAAAANFSFLNGEAVEEFHSATEVSVAAHSTGTLLVPAKNLTLKCAKAASAIAAPMKILPLSTLAEGAITFSECLTTAMSTGKAVHSCNPVEPIVANGLAHLVLHGSINFLELTPLKSELFTTIEFGELCALTETSEVTGSLILECGHLQEAKFASLDCANHETTKLLRPAPAELFPKHKLKFGENSATLDGIVSGTVGSPNFSFLGAEVIEEFSSDTELSVNSYGTGLLSVPAEELEIKCAKAASDPTSPLELQAASTLVEGNVNFDECSTTLEGKVEPECDPERPIEVEGRGHLVLHKTVSFILFEPFAGKPLATVDFTQKVCPWLKDSTITGSVVLECGRLTATEFVSADCANHETAKLLRPVPAELFPGHGLEVGENPASLTGVVTVTARGPGLRYLDAGLVQEFHTNEPVDVSFHQEGRLLFPKFSSEIKCQNLMPSVSGLDITKLSSQAEGSITIKNCQFLKEGKVNKNCTPAEPIVAGGIARLIAHGGINYVLVEPPKGVPYTVMEFSEACGFVESWEVDGSAVFECGHLEAGEFVKLDCANHQITQLLRSAPSGLFSSDSINFGEQKLLIDGVMEVSLIGGLMGLPWGGHP